ncbi:hypothetical protein RRG08_052620 [Elysia crispata]|uniref:Uncharacterized protein n=1 Tax=Elysia crispata TaxID=231223 RepID=A0AAE1AHS5_9GAST|nr:hypothetical protein RRG08_052620 [Elysia crispata]
MVVKDDRSEQQIGRSIAVPRQRQDHHSRFRKKLELNLMFSVTVMELNCVHRRDCPSTTGHRTDISSGVWFGHSRTVRHQLDTDISSSVWSGHSRTVRQQLDTDISSGIWFGLDRTDRHQMDTDISSGVWSGHYRTVRHQLGDMYHDVMERRGLRIQTS